MIYFPDTLLKRYTYTDTGVDLYGATKKQYTYIDDILVDFQNENNNEVAKSYGVELANLYKIYTDNSTPLQDTDMLEDSNGNQYHIIGNIRKYTHFHNYKKANLIKYRKGSEQDGL